MIGDGTEGKILCLECKREFGALAGHVASKHAMSLQEYRLRHTADGSGDDVNVGWIPTRSGPVNSPTAPPRGSGTPSQASYESASSIQANLSPAERKQFEDRYALLFKQADDDEALASHIQDIVLGEINVARYQDQISRITLRMTTGKFDKADTDRLSLLSNLVKQTQATNLSLMNSLNLTRDKKQKNSVSIETTPSRFVAAYEKLTASFTREQFERNQRDEEDALKRLHAKGKDLRDLVPVEVRVE